MKTTKHWTFSRNKKYFQTKTQLLDFTFSENKTIRNQQRTEWQCTAENHESLDDKDFDIIMPKPDTFFLEDMEVEDEGL